MTKSAGQLANSLITGFQQREQKPERSIGQPHGATGSGVKSIVTQSATLAQVQQKIDSLSRACASPLTTQDEADRLQAQIEAVLTPAPVEWIVGKLTVLFSMYPAEQVDDNAALLLMDQYISALRELPAWALGKAFDWWVSDENKFYYRKPFPADLSARAKQAMAPVSRARTRLDGFHDRQAYREETLRLNREKEKAAPDRGTEAERRAFVEKILIAKGFLNPDGSKLDAEGGSVLRSMAGMSEEYKRFWERANDHPSRLSAMLTSGGDA